MSYITESDVLEYKQLIQKDSYKDTPAVSRVNYVISGWFSETCSADLSDGKDMQLIYDTFSLLFPYSGPIYRGIILEDITTLEGKNVLVSSTSEVGNALLFAGAIEDHGANPFTLRSGYKNNGYLVRAYVEYAFNLSDFMLYVLEHTTAIGLASDLDTYIYENEIITFLPQEKVIILIKEDNLNQLSLDEVKSFS